MKHYGTISIHKHCKKIISQNEVLARRAISKGANNHDKIVAGKPLCFIAERPIIDRTQKPTTPPFLCTRPKYCRTTAFGKV
jgi:hypothetical protein